jgi:regulator of protease activity HflC (stomatin/prohibitin superfamily)
MLTLLLALMACTMHSTESNEVGVRVNLLTGLDSEIYPPGGTYFLFFLSDWYTFSTKAQTLEMTANPSQVEDAAQGDLEFKTSDGNDIGVDVTVIYRLVPEQAAHVLTQVARNDESLKESIVRPLARSIIRDVLNELTSEDVYAGKKFQAADKARAALDAALTPYGLRCDNVILGDHRFHDRYQTAINDRKVFDQQANTLRSAAENVQREWEAKLEATKGEVERKIAQENGKQQQTMLAADAYYVARQKEAEAILAEKTASAEGIQKMNQALAGSGGRVMVKRRIAEALQGKRIVVLPGGSSAVDVQKLDVNSLLQTYAAAEASR